MNVHDATIVEMHQLMLSATLDRVHSRAAESTQCGRRDATAQRRMQHSNSLDRRVLNCAPQSTDSSLDFRKFRHAALCKCACC